MKAHRVHPVLTAAALLGLAACGAGHACASGTWQPASSIASSPALLDGASGPHMLVLDCDQVMRRVNAPTEFTLGFRPFGESLGEGWPGRARNAWERTLGSMTSAVTLRGPTEAPPGTCNARHSNVTDHFAAELRVPLSAAAAGSDGTGEPITSATPDGVSAPAPSQRPAGTPVALDLVADTYETGFGRDLYSATMIADGIHGSPLIANGGFRAEERIRRRRDWEVKLAAGTRLSWHPPLARRITATIGGGELLRNHGRKAVTLASTELDVPVRDAFALTGALTCSNRPERYREGLVRGVIGLSYHPSAGR